MIRIATVRDDSVVMDEIPPGTIQNAGWLASGLDQGHAPASPPEKECAEGIPGEQTHLCKASRAEGSR